MADFSSFGSASFSSVDWINGVMKEFHEDEALESNLAQLSMKLHILTQDYTDQLELGKEPSSSLLQSS
jgi:hypothetical protein